MAHRIKQRQKIHDKKVQEVARRLRRAGYFVRADLPGHPRPPRFGGAIPDIYAHKKGKKLIYEIETPKSLKTDIEMRQALARAADRAGAEFRILVAREKII